MIKRLAILGVGLIGGSLARALRDATSVEIVQLDPPGDVEMGRGVSGISGARLAPMASGSLRGAALDVDSTEPEIISRPDPTAARGRAALGVPPHTPRARDARRA